MGKSRAESEKWAKEKAEEFVKSGSNLTFAEWCYQKGKADAQDWIPVETRLLTDEERPVNFPKEAWVLCGNLPDPWQQVLITTDKGEVTMTGYGEIGNFDKYFAGYEEKGEVIAWMPLPKQYISEQERNDNEEV